MATKNYTESYSKYKIWNEKHQGVYGIFDKQTGECLYVGSSKAVNRRLNRHKTSINNLNYAKQWYPGQLDLYKSLTKHSELFFEILEECEKTIIRQLEKFYIKVYQPKYNTNK